MKKKYMISNQIRSSIEDKVHLDFQLRISALESRKDLLDALEDIVIKLRKEVLSAPVDKRIFLQSRSNTNYQYQCHGFVEE